MDDFELTMQDAPRTDTRLEYIADLRGETILAVFDCCDGADLLIVTENRNWIVLDAEAGYSCDDGATIEVVRQPPLSRYDGTVRQEESIADYVTPRELLSAGVITPAAFQVLQERADAKAAEERQRKVDRLRFELEKLNAGTVK